MNTMKIEIIPALELIGALLNYAMRGEEAEDWIETSPEIIAWRKSVEERISPFLASDTEQLFQCRAPYGLLVYAVVRQELNTPEQLIDWLKGGHTDIIRELILERIGLESGDWENLDLTQLKDLIEKEELSFHRPAEDEASLMMYALQQPEDFLQRLVLVLSDFYSQFLSDIFDEVIQRLEIKRADHQTRLEQNPAAFLNQISLDNYSSLYNDTEEIRIIINYFANRFTSLHAKKLPLITYGFDIEQIFRSPDLVKQNEQFIKALADPKRAAVLRLLKRRQWYGKELADHFKLTTATMSYHMEKLVSSRLVRFEMGDKNRVLYSINRDGFETMLETLRKDFL